MKSHREGNLRWNRMVERSNRTKARIFVKYRPDISGPDLGVDDPSWPMMVEGEDFEIDPKEESELGVWRAAELAVSREMAK